MITSSGDKEVNLILGSEIKTIGQGGESCKKYIWVCWAGRGVQVTNWKVSILGNNMCNVLQIKNKFMVLRKWRNVQVAGVFTE